MSIEANIALMASMGKYGGKRIDDTSATTPDSGFSFCAIKAITNTVINTVTGNVDLDSVTIYAGDIFYGNWSSITLTSGDCIAYNISK